MISIKMHSIDGRFVTGPSDILFSGMYVCTFRPGNFTVLSSEGVNETLKWLSLFLCYAGVVLVVTV